MKKYLGLVLALSLLLPIAGLHADNSKPVPVRKVVAVSTTSSKPGVVAKQATVGDNLTRGVGNLLLCWIELPKQIVKQGSLVPIFGIVSGAMYGATTTVWRAFAGVTDILSLGFGGGDVFFRQGLPKYPWQGEWISRDGK